jgi:hypothetical protein
LKLDEGGGAGRFGELGKGKVEEVGEEGGLGEEKVVFEGATKRGGRVREVLAGSVGGKREIDRMERTEGEIRGLALR